MGFLGDLLIRYAAYKAEDWSASRLPVVAGTLNVPGLHAEVEVIREPGTGVPHIQAKNEHDMYFAQGYTHAADRLWQMHLLRTLARGQLSEAFGEPVVFVDRFARSLGWGRLARSSWNAYLRSAGDTKAHAVVVNMVQAYVEGINAFLDNSTSKLPVEFKLAKIVPRKWTCVDVLAAERVMGFQLSCGFQQKVIRGRLMHLVGSQNTAYFSHFDPNVPTPMSEPLEEESKAASGFEGLEQVFAEIESIWRVAEEGKESVPDRGQGSNAWAISGSKTASGKPLLASDPHLKLAQPHIWSVHHLVVSPQQDAKQQQQKNKKKQGQKDAVNCFGVTLPGYPGVVMGRNDNVAWGVTLSYVDIEDLYVEKVRTLPDGATQYLFKDKWEPVTWEKEDIVVKGKGVEEFRVAYTHHGPIISDLVSDFTSGTGVNLNVRVSDAKEAASQPCPYVFKMALASKTLLPESKTLLSSYFINRSTNWTQFVTAAREMNTPLLNYVYADVHGDIGYIMPGDCPKRVKNHSGLMPVPGWTGECEWESNVPMNEMPFSHNPEQGFIVSCNHQATPPDYPHYLGQQFWPGYRARVATNHLKAKAKGWTVKDCKNLQMNVYSIHGKLFVDLLREANFKVKTLFDPFLPMKHYEVMATALDQVYQWNYEVSADSAAACIYEVWIYCLMHSVFGTGLKKAWMDKHPEATDEAAQTAIEPLLGFLKGDPFNPTVKTKNEIGSFSHSAILRILSQDSCNEQLANFNSMPNKPSEWKERPKGWKPDNYWLKCVGGLESVLLRTLLQTVKICGNKFGAATEVSEWQWGGMHELTLAHSMSRKLGQDPFDCYGYPIGGDMLTLNLASTTLDGKFEACRQAGVSWRLIVDFSDMNNSQWMMPCGNSGHLSSPYYNNLTAKFLEGKFERALTDSKELSEKATQMFQLKMSPNAHNSNIVREPRSQRSRTSRGRNPLIGPFLMLLTIVAVLFMLSHVTGFQLPEQLSAFLRNPSHQMQVYYRALTSDGTCVTLEYPQTEQIKLTRTEL